MDNPFPIQSEVKVDAPATSVELHPDFLAQLSAGNEVGLVDETAIADEVTQEHPVFELVADEGPRENLESDPPGNAFHEAFEGVTEAIPENDPPAPVEG